MKSRIRELGENALADEIIEIYVEAHKENPEIFDLSNYSFSGDITDAAIRDQFEQLTEQHKVVRTVKDVLSKIFDKDSWSGEDERILADASSDKFYDVFKSEQGKYLSSYIDTCLGFGRFSNASEQQKKIADNATLALKRIAKESDINEKRVNKFGIKLDGDDAEQPKNA